MQDRKLAFVNATTDRRARQFRRMQENDTRLNVSLRSRSP